MSCSNPEEEDTPINDFDDVKQVHNIELQSFLYVHTKALFGWRIYLSSFQWKKNSILD